MKCPVCGTHDSRVLDSRPVEDDTSIRRRRECPSCGKRFTTYEVVETVPVTVIKKDGTREFFDRQKLFTGIMRACQKRPVNADDVTKEIEQELEKSLSTEITSEAIGEMVMERLKALDAVSYVRFASVYREFKDADTFLSELRSIIGPSKRGKSKK